MTIEEALAVLERGRLEPLYILSGPNRYWGQAWLARVRGQFLGEAQDTGFVRFEALSDFKTIQLELAAGGFFGDRKLVVIENARWNKKDEVLEQYMANPIPDTLLVLFEDKISASLEKSVGSHRIIHLKPLPSVAFRRFVKEEASRRTVILTDDGFEEFCRMVPGNEYQVIQELEKMALFRLDKWNAQDVAQQVLPMPSDEPIWDVTDALLRHDLSKTLKLARRHLSMGAAPLMLFIVMARQVIHIDQARRAQAAGLSVALFQEQEGLKDFVAKKLWSAARLWSSEELQSMLDWAVRIDVYMKTGYGEPDVWLMLWVALIAGKKIPPGQKPGGRKDRI